METLNTMTNTVQDHTQWLEARRHGIGGSDIAAIMGVSRWKTPLGVYLEKTEGAIQPDNKYMRAGRFLEDGVALYYADLTGHRIVPPKERIARHPLADIFLASVDRMLITEAGTETPDAVLEIKTTQREILEVEPEWFCQLQWYLGVTGLPFGVIAWLERGLELRYEEFDANKDYIGKMQDAAWKFWRDHVLAKKQPEPTTEGDIAMLYPAHVSGKVIEADKDAVNLYKRLAEAKADKKRAEEIEEDLVEEMKLLMRDAEMLIAGDTPLCTFKKDRDGKAFDTKTFSAAYPQMFEQFTRPKTGARKLLVK
ncbi:MAG TPA: YqaJ viral recombinase family protein [Candidatus Kapabacteria bacterium]|nr:YqaJ viral recombinase family protein [Candidatus Kapabacteria bacterium]